MVLDVNVHNFIVYMDTLAQNGISDSEDEDMMLKMLNKIPDSFQLCELYDGIIFRIIQLGWFYAMRKIIKKSSHGISKELIQRMLSKACENTENCTKINAHYFDRMIKFLEKQLRAKNENEIKIDSETETASTSSEEMD